MVHSFPNKSDCFKTMLFPNCPPTDPTQAPVLCQPQLPPHGSQSNGGGVQPHVIWRTHPHRTVSFHCVRPGAHGEDCCRQAQLQIESHHCLNLPAPVPSDCTVTHQRQVRPAHSSWSCRTPSGLFTKAEKSLKQPPPFYRHISCLHCHRTWRNLCAISFL